MPVKAFSGKPEVNSKYLACYALHPAVKKECTDRLALQYIDSKLQQDKTYLQEFQFEAEKQGFRDFLSNHGLPCKTIEERPEFVEDKQAYLVTCKHEGQYFMRFNYEIGEWQLIKEEQNNER